MNEEANSRFNLPKVSPSQCVVLVPVGDNIHPACESGLAELERRGYAVWRVSGYAAIDQGRNQMSTDALNKGFEVTMWIDSDIGFESDDVDRLLSLNRPLVCGIYPKKGLRELASHMLPGTKEIVFGRNGGLIEIKYAGAGFLMVRREVYESIQTKLELPVCNTSFRRPMIPFFLPMTILQANHHWYLAEDYAFCERARQSGFKIIADSTIRLYHYGSYGYSWEDAGQDVRRYVNYNYALNASSAIDSANAVTVGPDKSSSG